MNREMTEAPQGHDGGNEEFEQSVAGETTLVVSLGDSLGATAAMPVDAAGEGTVVGALTWETGAVYKHVAMFYSKIQRPKVHSNL